MSFSTPPLATLALLSEEQAILTAKPHNAVEQLDNVRTRLSATLGSANQAASLRGAYEEFLACAEDLITGEFLSVDWQRRGVGAERRSSDGIRSGGTDAGSKCRGAPPLIWLSPPTFANETEVARMMAADQGGSSTSPLALAAVGALQEDLTRLRAREPSGVRSPNGSGIAAHRGPVYDVVRWEKLLRAAVKALVAAANKLKERLAAAPPPPRWAPQVLEEAMDTLKRHVFVGMLTRMRLRLCEGRSDAVGARRDPPLFSVDPYMVTEEGAGAGHPAGVRVQLRTSVQARFDERLERLLKWELAPQLGCDLNTLHESSTTTTTTPVGPGVESARDLLRGLDALLDSVSHALHEAWHDLEARATVVGKAYEAAMRAALAETPSRGRTTLYAAQTAFFAELVQPHAALPGGEADLSTHGVMLSVCTLQAHAVRRLTAHVRTSPARPLPEKAGAHPVSGGAQSHSVDVDAATMENLFRSMEGAPGPADALSERLAQYRQRRSTRGGRPFAACGPLQTVERLIAAQTRARPTLAGELATAQASATSAMSPTTREDSLTSHSSPAASRRSHTPSLQRSLAAPQALVDKPLHALRTAAVRADSIGVAESTHQQRQSPKRAEAGQGARPSPPVPEKPRPEVTRAVAEPDPVRAPDCVRGVAAPPSVKGASQPSPPPPPKVVDTPSPASSVAVRDSGAAAASPAAPAPPPAAKEAVAPASLSSVPPLDARPSVTESEEVGGEEVDEEVRLRDKVRQQLRTLTRDVPAAAPVAAEPANTPATRAVAETSVRAEAPPPAPAAPTPVVALTGIAASYPFLSLEPCRGVYLEDLDLVREPRFRSALHRLSIKKSSASHDRVSLYAVEVEVRAQEEAVNAVARAIATELREATRRARTRFPFLRARVRGVLLGALVGHLEADELFTSLVQVHSQVVRGAAGAADRNRHRLAGVERCLANEAERVAEETLVGERGLTDEERIQQSLAVLEAEDGPSTPTTDGAAGVSESASPNGRTAASGPSTGRPPIAPAKLPVPTDTPAAYVEGPSLVSQGELKPGPLRKPAEHTTTVAVEGERRSSLGSRILYGGGGGGGSGGAAAAAGLVLRRSLDTAADADAEGGRGLRHSRPASSSFSWSTDELMGCGGAAPVPLTDDGCLQRRLSSRRSSKGGTPLLPVPSPPTTTVPASFSTESPAEVWGTRHVVHPSTDPIATTTAASVCLPPPSRRARPCGALPLLDGVKRGSFLRTRASPHGAAATPTPTPHTSSSGRAGERGAGAGLGLPDSARTLPPARGVLSLGLFSGRPSLGMSGGSPRQRSRLPVAEQRPVKAASEPGGGGGSGPAPTAWGASPMGERSAHKGLPPSPPPSEPEVAMMGWASRQGGVDTSRMLPLSLSPCETPMARSDVVLSGGAGSPAPPAVVQTSVVRSFAQTMPVRPLQSTVRTLPGVRGGAADGSGTSPRACWSPDMARTMAPGQQGAGSLPLRLALDLPANASLHETYLAACEALGVRPNSALMRTFPTTAKTYVDRVDLSINYVGAKGLVPVLYVLEANGSHLRHLSLRNNNLENLEVLELVQVLSGSAGEHLVHLDLSYNPISQTGGQALLRFCSSRPELVAIRLKGTLIPPKLMQTILDKVEDNSFRKHIGLS